MLNFLLLWHFSWVFLNFISVPFYVLDFSDADILHQNYVRHEEGKKWNRHSLCPSQSLCLGAKKKMLAQKGSSLGWVGACFAGLLVACRAVLRTSRILSTLRNTRVLPVGWMPCCVQFPGLKVFFFLSPHYQRDCLVEISSWWETSCLLWRKDQKVSGNRIRHPHPQPVLHRD